MLGACSGSSDVETTEQAPKPTSAEEGSWREQVDQACASLSGEYNDLEAAQLTDRAAALAHIARMTDFADAVAAATSPLSAPDAGPEAAALAENFAALRDTTIELADAAQAGDAAAVQRAVGDLGELGDQVNAGAAALGIESCGGF